PAECAQGESRGSAGAAACDTPSAGLAETGRGAGAGGGEPLGGRAGKKYRCKSRTWINERR
ncbi:unnamed protein product, partial [Bubo scandiacus]